MSRQNLDIYYLSEKAVTITFGNTISPQLLQLVTAFDAQVNQNPFPGFHTTIPAYATLTVVYNPMLVIGSADMAGTTCFEKVMHYLNALYRKQQNIKIAEPRTITIPVCYGNDFGPDLAGVAKLHQMTEQEVIGIHSSAEYEVCMIGFIPGFAYLGGMPEILDTPRKPNPRKSVAAGSIGIAGKQTGIYPLDVPGGWQIIGRTPLVLFDAGQQPPALLKAGDRIVFKPISLYEYQSIIPNLDAAKLY